MGLRLLRFALLLIPVFGFEKGFLATKVFPVNKIKAQCKPQNQSLYTFPLPCHVSDLLTLFGASHFSSTLQPYLDPALVKEKIEGYTTTEWYRDSLDVYVRTVNYNLTLNTQSPVQIEEIQTVRNFTTNFLFHRFISLANADEGQKFVIDVLNCGHIKENVVQLQTSVSATSYSQNPNGTLLESLKQEIRESTRAYGHSMTKHCTERNIHIPINYIFLQMKESPAFEDEHIYRHRTPVRVTVMNRDEWVSMYSIARQHVHRYLFNENLYTGLTTSIPAEERENNGYLGLIGACVIFFLFIAVIISPSCCGKQKGSEPSGVSSPAPIPVPNSTPIEAHCIEQSAEKQRDMRNAVAATLVADLTDRIVDTEETVQRSETPDAVVIEMKDISVDVHL